MTPSLSVPTDNIYKFASLFGLALIIASVLSFVSVYSFTLSEKVKISETINTMEAKTGGSKTDEDALKRSKRLLEVHSANEKHANNVITVVIALGIASSIWGFSCWKSRVQGRDDRLVELQIKRLELEVAQLEAQQRPVPPKVDSATPGTT